MDVFIIRHGGATVKETGGGVSFNVIAVTNKDALPGTADNGTIAVISDQTVDAAYMLPKFPESANVGDVLVWNVGTETLIHQSEDGKTATGVAGVYIKGEDAWEFADSYIFENNAWRCLWLNRLYYEGDECEDYSGGWIGRPISSRSSASATLIENLNIIRAATYMQTNTRKDNGQDGVCMLTTANMIDLTPFEKITVEGTFTSQYTNYALNLTLGAWSKVPDYYQNDRLAYVEFGNKSSSTSATVDVSGINQMAYIGFGTAYSVIKMERLRLIPKTV